MLIVVKFQLSHQFGNWYGLWSLKLWILLVYFVDFFLRIFALKLFWKKKRWILNLFVFIVVNFFFSFFFFLLWVNFNILEYWGWLMTAFHFFPFEIWDFWLWNQMLRTMIRLMPYDRNTQSQSSEGGAKSMRGIFECYRSCILWFPDFIALITLKPQ
jgi:hypothetical protein